jgi:hypothetical protein
MEDQIMGAIKLTGWMTVGLLAGVAPALAQGTEAQRSACMPDAFRLCSSYIPDAGQVETCLRNAGPRLSSGCYVVFYPPTVAPNRTQAAAPNRMQSARAPAPQPRFDDDDND